MRVWKSVGAVAVYNRRRAIVALATTILALFGAGLVLGLVIAGGTGDSNEASAAEPQRTAAAATKPATADKEPDTTTADAPAPDAAALEQARDRAYARGYKQGVGSVFPKDNDFETGGAYMVRLKRGKGGALTIGPNLTVVEGNEYFLCGGGERLCIRKPK